MKRRRTPCSGCGRRGEISVESWGRFGGAHTAERGVAGWAGLVADLQILAATELFDELSHSLWAILKPVQATNMPATLGDRRGDGCSVDIEPQISCTLIHGRLLRCGDASWFFHQA